MDKLTAVEYSFKHGGEIVLYDEGTDLIWVCFGGSSEKGNTITFKDCSVADVSDDCEYYGEIMPNSYDLTYDIGQPVSDTFIPTRFYSGELVLQKKRRG